MTCNEAKTWIDRRIQAEADGDSDESRDWSVLNIHLASCPNCQADLEQLRRTRTLLHDASSEGPNPKETETMFTAIAASAAGPVMFRDAKQRKSLVWQMAVASISVAAVLGLAFQLGNMNLGHGWELSAARRQSRTPTSLLHTVVPGGWGYPVQPEQYVFANVDNSLATGATPDVMTERRNPRTAKARRSAPSKTASLRARGRKKMTPSAGTVDSQYFADAMGPNDSARSLVSASAVSSVDTENIAYGYQVPFLGRSAYGSDGDEAEHERLEALGYVASPPDAEESLGEYFASRPARNSIRSIYKGRRKVPGTEDADLDRTQGIEQNNQPAPRQAPPATTKIIKTGFLSTEVERYGEAVQQVEQVVSEHGGFVADASTREQKGGALSGSIKIRVSPPSFEALFAQLKTIGRLESEDVKASDVTAQFVDLESRIGSLQVMEDRLGELVKNKSFVDKVSSLLEVERELKRVRTEREQLVGQLRVMSDRIGLSTITMSLHEPSRTVPSATLGVEVGVLEDAAKSLGEVLVSLDGRLISGETRRQDNGTRRGEYQIEVRLPHFRETLTAIENLGRVETRQTSDQQFGSDQASWASKVPCRISLVLHERWRPLPAGTMQLEVDRLDDALSQLTGGLAKCEASIISNETTRRNDGSNAAELKLRIPAGRFAELITAIDSIGRITAKSVSGDVGRIVGGAASQSCELRLTLSERTKEVPRGQMAIEVKAFAAARTTLSQLIKDQDIQLQSSDGSQRSDGSSTGVFTLGVKATNLEDVVTSLESLGRVRSRQIRGIGLGDLSRVDPESLGVLHLTLYEPSAISPGPEHASGTIRARLRDGLRGMYNSFGLIVSGLIIMVPWVLLIIMPAWLLVRAMRKRKAARTQAEAT